MKLDPRIIEGKKPLDCFDTDIARQFIGKKGYFAEDLSIYANVGYAEARTLQEIADNKTHCFKDDVIDVRWSYFLPEEWVQKKEPEPEPEPEWVPYDIDTFKMDGYITGRLVTFRRKSWADDAAIQTVMYLGYRESVENLDDVQILLGNEWFGFQRLFEYCEIFDNKYSDDNLCRWRPFGYQE